MGAHRYRLLLLLLAGMAGCASVGKDQQTVVTMAGQVQDLEARLAEAHAALAAVSADQQTAREDLMLQIGEMNAQLEDLPEAVAALCVQPVTTASSQCDEFPPPAAVVMSGDKMVVGELERVWIDPPGAAVIARIDTGAQSSSVHAENLVEFERDGDDWVRFELILKGEVSALERRVIRYVRIYQQADREGTRRPVVSMRLRLGDVQNSFEFTLADRSHLEYQMLLGRNFLADMALVDVGKQFIQPDYRPTDE
jgi:hypothetical protein